MLQFESRPKSRLFLRGPSSPSYPAVCLMLSNLKLNILRQYVIRINIENTNVARNILVYESNIGLNVLQNSKRRS